MQGQSLNSKVTLIKLGVLALLAAGILGGSLYFNTVKVKVKSLQTEAQMSWLQLEASYQRQADFIPFLAQHLQPLVKEKPLLEKSVKLFNEKGKRVFLENQENLPQFEHAQLELGIAVNNLLALQEADPKLKKIKPLNEARNLINDVRRKIIDHRKIYFQKNQVYNMELQKFPGNIVAPTIGAAPRPYFNETAPNDTARDFR